MNPRPRVGQAQAGASHDPYQLSSCFHNKGNAQEPKDTVREYGLGTPALPILSPDASSSNFESSSSHYKVLLMWAQIYPGHV